MKRHKTVEEYLSKVERWGDELQRLREIILQTGIEEGVRWGVPAYLHKGKIVLGIAGFKKHFAVWFHQGALLKDKKGFLVNAQEGRTKAMRQWRHTSAKDIKARYLKAYVKEAMALVEEGKEIKANRNKKLELPAELADAFKKNKKAQAAFKKLTPGKQREYANHVADAKREATKIKRIEKILPMIESGIGLYDKYKNC